MSNECSLCKNEFDLFKGKCITYAFNIVYYVDYYNENIQIFNPDKKDIIYAIKIENEIMDPISQFNFKNYPNNKVYFYFLEETPISLSNLFDNNIRLIDFSFNIKYINNFKFTNIKGMLSGCSSLIFISIYLKLKVL